MPDYDETVLEIETPEAPEAREVRVRRTLEVGYRGVAGRVDAEAVRHFLDRGNPHGDGVGNAAADEAHEAHQERWPYNEGGRVGLHARPLHYEDIDWPDVKDRAAKADADDPAEGYLGAKAAGALRLSPRHVVCLAGDEGAAVLWLIGTRLYYGTDALGALGWHPCPWEAGRRADR